MAEEVAEGLQLLEYTIRMRLRNRVVVDTLTAGGRVDVAAWEAAARAAIGTLRDEAAGSAARMATVLRAARVAGRAEDEHDYRARDTANLRRRRKVYRRITRRLGAWAQDPVRIAELVAEAGEEARAELEREIALVTRAADSISADDAALLRARLALIGQVDLPALERDRKDRGAVR